VLRGQSSWRCAQRLGEAKDSVKRREGSDPVVEYELGRVEEILEVHGAPSLTLWSAQRRRPCAGQ
jgi:hypothetical protein